MKTIVFIESQKFGSSREAIRAAENLNYFTVLLTNKPKFIQNREDFPDVHYMKLSDLNNIDQIMEEINQLKLKALEICAVVSFMEEYCYTACLIADKLGINKISTNGIKNMSDKIESRELLNNTPYIPYYNIIYNPDQIREETIKDKFPLILKAPNSCGSKDVIKVNNINEYKKYIKHLTNKYPKDPILIEEYLLGKQFLVETVVNKNKLNIIAIIEQEITYEKRFIVTGYSLIHNPDKEFFDILEKTVKDIIDAHGMTNGACHLELKYTNSGWKLIEINPRISGAGMNKILEIALGINLVKETLKLILGIEPDLKPRYKKEVFAQYVTVSNKGILNKVTGKNRAIKSNGVEFVYVRPKKGTILVPPLSMGNRYALIIASGDTAEKAKQNAKSAASQIEFKVSPINENEEKEC